MKVGFTGTQRGMSRAQRDEVYRILLDLKPKEFHHGDCIGADFDAAMLAVSQKINIVVHPPENRIKRAFVAIFSRMLPPKPYLERNHDIVDATDCLIATPGEFEEQLRSGTWATIRYARKMRKKVYMVMPDGMVVEA